MSVSLTHTTSTMFCFLEIRTHLVGTILSVTSGFSHNNIPYQTSKDLCHQLNQNNRKLLKSHSTTSFHTYIISRAHLPSFFHVVPLLPFISIAPFFPFPFSFFWSAISLSCVTFFFPLSSFSQNSLAPNQKKNTHTCVFPFFYKLSLLTRVEVQNNWNLSFLTILFNSFFCFFVSFPWNDPYLQMYSKKWFTSE